MIEIRHRKPSDYSVQPWKNGLGTTTELSKDSATPFHWRLSRAKLTVSGSFSNYPGYDRALLLLKGGPLVLIHSTGKSRHLYPLTAYSFSGDWNTSMELSSPGEDFNMLLLRGKAKGGLYPTPIKFGEEMQFPIAGNQHFLYCVEGSVKISERNLSQEISLGSQELFQLSRTDGKEYLNLKAVGIAPHSVLIWVVIRVL